MARLVPGCLALYKSKAAIVRAVNGDKLEISIAGGSSKSVRPKDIVFLHSGPVSSLPLKDLPEPDCGELAELMGEELLSFGEFLECAYGGNTPEAAWNAWKLLSCGLYFSGDPDSGVRAKPAQDVAAALKALHARESEAAARSALIERIRSGRIDPENDRSAIRELEQVAYGVIENSRLMRDLGMESAPDTAHMLLLKLKCWSDLSDPWPMRAGVEVKAPEFSMDDVPDVERRDQTWLEAYAIDDRGSADPDDAIAYDGTHLLVHVADPDAGLLPGGPADLEARERGENLYLPEGVTPMLPEEATAKFGLGLAETSPAWTFVLDFAGDGRPELLDFFPSMVRVSRHDYDTAQGLFDGPLAGAVPLLERFKDYRRKERALFIRMPEVKVKVIGKDIEVVPIEFSPVREVVAHAMLAAGSAVAQYAAEHEIAMPFVIQAPAELEEIPAEDAALSIMYAARRACAPGVLSPWPGRHAGLGLEPYVRVTSPLRRYADLLAHRQLRRIFRHEAPMTAEEMEAAFAPAEDAGLVRTRLERDVNEFYKIVWFQRHPDWRGEAVAVQQLEGGRCACMIPELAFEFKTRFGNGDLQTGKRYPVELEFADPVTRVCRFRFSRELD